MEIIKLPIGWTPETAFNMETKESDSTFSFTNSLDEISQDFNQKIKVVKINRINIFKDQYETDSISYLKMLTRKIIVYFAQDSLDLDKINELLKAELKRH